MYCANVTHVSATDNHTADVKTHFALFTKPGTIASEIVTVCNSVLYFANRRAGTAMPLRASRERQTLIAISRAAINAAGSHHTQSRATKTASEPSTINLSANGSRKMPNSVMP